MNACYIIVRHNVRTYESAGVVEVVKGRRNAEASLEKLKAFQESGDHHEGWRYFLEKTDLPAGMDPVKATHLRQAGLELRESEATASDPMQSGSQTLRVGSMKR